MWMVNEFIIIRIIVRKLVNRLKDVCISQKMRYNKLTLKEVL